MKHWLPRLVLWSSLLALAVVLGPAQPIVRSANREVTSPADSGAGTLRQALWDAGAGDTITFNPSVFPPGSPVTIRLRSPLPTLNKDNVMVDASNAGVILDGSAAGAGANGLIIEADGCAVRGLRIRYFSSNGVYIAPGASGNTVGGDQSLGSGPYGQGNLIANNGGSGVEVRGGNNAVRGNTIGIDPSGRWDWGNAYNGVAMWQGASGNTVGGAASGLRNVISGNDQNGVWIGGAGSDGNVVSGNFIGTRSDGAGAIPNGFSGVSIQGGAKNNVIGGAVAGAGNVISGNRDHGIYIADPGTGGNRILGNLIGPDRHGTGSIGQGLNGVVLTGGTSDNTIGDGTPGGRNLISGNSLVGVRVEGSATVSNTLQGNYVGTNISGTLALPNGLHGIELAQGTHSNLVGGNRFGGQGNLLSGNGNHGIVITLGAHDNRVLGNLIGPDATGAYSLGNHPYGGIDIANGAHDNQIGGLGLGEGNVVSGNQMDGIAVVHYEDGNPIDNSLLGNLIGLAGDGVSALPNGGYGILVSLGAVRTRLERNIIAYNDTYGVLVAECTGNTLTQNAIYSNGLGGIENEGDCPPAPGVLGVTLAATETVTGTTVPNARLEFFSEDDAQGRVYEGWAQADASGGFSFSKAGGFTGPNVTATSTDGNGNTSEFSAPAHLAWTMLLYLNGDNDLEEFMFDTLTNTVAAGASPRANVLMLVDGYTTTQTYSGTVLYDVTRGQVAQLDVPLTAAGERNMGDRGTLEEFVTWGRDHYPARHTMLAIVDHGSGWAPGGEAMPSGALAGRRSRWMAGASGLSWDFTDDYDYLDSEEIRQAMAAITSDGADPLDVVFYDVCLMGLLEVAYQIKDYASFFVSSQNIGWAPLGAQARYVRTIQGLAPTTGPREMAEWLVETYADSMPLDLHPFTISAVDMSALPPVATGVDQLAAAISETLGVPGGTALLHAVYSETQKLDYDSDFRIEPATDGFVDLYDLAFNAAQQFSDPDVVNAAQTLMSALDTAVLAEAHRSGVPWLAQDRMWDLNDAHGLSIFMPLGEDLELPVVITETSPITPSLEVTRYLRLRDLYSSDELQFVGDSAWGSLIDSYYDVVASPIPTGTTEGPVDGLQRPDITPPATHISLSGTLAVGENITVTWSAADTQSGVTAATLWHRPPRQAWQSVTTQTASAGAFPFSLSQWCGNGFAVRAVDGAGNVEPLFGKSNTVIVDVAPCSYKYLPVLWKQAP